MENYEELKSILSLNETISFILEKSQELHLKNWYLGAGCISQTAWNFKNGFDLNYGIGDYDLVYFDNSDLSYEAEDAYIQRGKKLFGNIPVEIRNQARVHLWFSKHFGYEINPHVSVEDAIATWPTTATCIGVKKEGNDLKIFAPYGIDDLMNLVVRANKKEIKENVYNKKVEKWKKLWPNLTVIPW